MRTPPPVALLLTGIGLLVLAFILVRNRQGRPQGAQGIAAFGIGFSIAATVDLLPLKGLWVIFVAGLLGLVGAELVFRRGPLRTTRLSQED